jgi:hypothetical protein
MKHPTGPPTADKCPPSVRPDAVIVTPESEPGAPNPQATRVTEISDLELRIAQAAARHGLTPALCEEAEGPSLRKMLRAALNGNVDIAEKTVRPRKLATTCVTAEVERLRAVGITEWRGAGSRKHPVRELSVKRLLMCVLDPTGCPHNPAG